MIKPPLPSLIMRSAPSRAQRKTPVRSTSITDWPLCEAHLADDRAVLDLDEQGVLGDARVVDQDVEAAEGRDDRIERPDDLLLARDVDDGGRDRRAAGLELGLCRLEVRRIQVEKCDVCPRAAKAVAMALPMPQPPPVTATTLSFNCMRGQRVISMAIEAVRRRRCTARLCRVSSRGVAAHGRAWLSVAPVAPIG